MRSLRARFLAVTAILLALSLATAGLLFSRIATHRLERMVELEPAGGPDPAARALASDWPSDPALALDRMRRFARESGRAVALVTGDAIGAVFVPDAGAEPRARATASGIEIEWQGSDGEAHLVRLIGGIALPGGARLFVGPGPRDRRTETRLQVAGLNRSLVIAAALVGLAGVALAFALSRRILGPVDSLTAAARRMEEGDLSARVSETSRDEIGALARAFNSMADRLGRTERLRRDLVSDVAHELRTPLTNLRGQIEAIQDGLAAPDAARIASLHEETRLLQKLVEDLQDLALAEAGGLRLEPEALDPRAELERAAAAISGAATQGGLQVAVACEPGLPPLRADARRLAQVLRNLLSNAVTATPPGGRVTLSAARCGERVELAVADTGTGITAEDLPHVFERFWRADPSRDRSTGGAGLGLALVRQMVLAQGGEVRAESAPGAGSTFRVTLPLA